MVPGDIAECWADPAKAASGTGLAPPAGISPPCALTAGAGGPPTLWLRGVGPGLHLRMYSLSHWSDDVQPVDHPTAASTRSPASTCWSPLTGLGASWQGFRSRKVSLAPSQGPMIPTVSLCGQHLDYDINSDYQGTFCLYQRLRCPDGEDTWPLTRRRDPAEAGSRPGHQPGHLALAGSRQNPCLSCPALPSVVITTWRNQALNWDQWEWVCL